ncbi:MAG TPA: MFS transporter [Dehalococcoidia bacterium]|nr:MFS transporter [Dehalococcoidia bacterium]
MVFFGWWIAWAGCWLYFLNALAFTYGFSLFVEPLSREFGWSRAAISAVWSATLGVGMISAVPAGWALDRWGARAVALATVPLVAAGWIGVTLVTSYWAYFLVFAGLVGLGIQPALVMAGQSAVANWFRRERGQAFAILSQGAGLAGIFGVPLIGWLLSLGDWRVAARALGLLILVAGLGLSLVLRPDPARYHLEPDGGSTPDSRRSRSDRPRRDTWRERLPAALQRTAPADTSLTPVEARATLTFWLLMGVYVARFVGMGVVTLHLVPYLQQQGHPAATASFALGLGLAASLPGRAIFGWAADRIATRWLLGVCLICQAASLVPVLLAGGESGLPLYLYAVLWGLGLGSENLIHSIRAEYFGQQFFGVISGYFTWPQMIGRMSGALIGGVILDQLGSYLAAFLIAAALYGLAAGLAFACGRPTPPARSSPADPAQIPLRI